MIEKMKKSIQFQKKKCILGACFGVAVFLLCAFFLSWQAGTLLGAGFLLAGSVQLHVESRRVIFALHAIWSIAVACVVWHMSYTALGAGHEMLVVPGVVVLNLLLIVFVCSALFILTARWRLSVAVGTLLLMLLALINAVVFQFRGKELAAADFLSIRTALNVAGGYRPSFDESTFLCLFIWLFTLFCGWCFPPFIFHKKLRARAGALVFAGGVLGLVFACSAHLPIKTWEKEGTRINGYFLNFFFTIRDSMVQKPENYGTESIQRLEYMYHDEKGISGELPNILVIMDESYADFDIFGEPLRTNKPVTPFIDSLTENTQKGYALTSVYGGNTANAEFEFLTGHTMGFLPKDSVPYQQFIRDNLFAMPRLMHALGYRTFATHPYYASGWSRERMYPYMGFEAFTFQDSYPQEDVYRNYISDREMFAYVLRVMDEAENGDRPLFLFGITMQNHGGYDYEGDRYQQEIYLEGYKRAYPLAEQYLSAIHKTDQAVEYLITELSKLEEKTVLLFFGDHFPKVEKELYETLLGGEYDTLEKQQMQYTIPFFIWANYDIEERETPLSSISYLQRHLLDAANIPLSPYLQFLKEAETVIPAINGLGYFSNIQNKHIPIENAMGKEKEWLNRYKTLQYNNLFDSKNRSDLFFGQYLPAE